MANFVDINVEVEKWEVFFVNVEEYDPEFTFKVRIDEDFLNEYDKALKVVERFQTYVDKELRKQLDERKR